MNDDDADQTPLVISVPWLNDGGAVQADVDRLMAGPGDDLAGLLGDEFGPADLGGEGG